jgi:site-specific DNA-methyltransferase (adenine-specific)
VPAEIAITSLRLDEIHPDPLNPRNNTGAVEMVAASIRKYGFLVPIVVDKDRKIVAGHTRFLAARMMRLGSVPCVQADELTPELAREFAIAENRTSDFSFFDLEKLAALAGEMSDEFVADFDIESLLSEVEFDIDAMPEDRTPDKREGLDLAPFEKYQYVCIICRTTYDYTNLLQRLGLDDLQRRYVGEYLKRGSSTGRVIEYPDFVAKIDGE